MMGSMADPLKLIRDLDINGIFEAQAIYVEQGFPEEPLIIHRRKCRIVRTTRCTCRPTIVSPPARV
jgi:hypothetical protein